MASMKRFAAHTQSEIIEKRALVVPDNTRRANRKSAKALKDYLEEKGQETEFENFTELRLSEVLSFFYLDARKCNGELYKSSTLENFRHSLNRYLKSPPVLSKIDIIKDTSFTEANESFKTAMTELKQAGKGDICHYPEIIEDDLHKLYRSLYTSVDTPHGLANKVQFDVRLYFCRRGGENMKEMNNDTFVLVETDDGEMCVKKKADELTKNRRSNEKEAYGGIMSECPESEYCPVFSFKKYVGKLHPELNRLWQRPKDTFLSEDPVWFCNRPLGKDSLSKFMTTLSSSCKLSQTYTNHSIRVTGTTIVSRQSFTPAQIMAVTGHKAVSSLAIYHRVKDGEKVSMGQAISGVLHPPKASIQPPCTAQNPACMSETQSNATAVDKLPTVTRGNSGEQEEATLSDLDGISWDDFFREPMECPVVPQPVPTMNNCMVTSTSTAPIF